MNRQVTVKAFISEFCNRQHNASFTNLTCSAILINNYTSAFCTWLNFVSTSHSEFMIAGYCFTGFILWLYSIYSSFLCHDWQKCSYGSIILWCFYDSWKFRFPTLYNVCLAFDSWLGRNFQPCNNVPHFHVSHLHSPRETYSVTNLPVFQPCCVESWWKSFPSTVGGLRTDEVQAFTIVVCNALCPLQWFDAACW